MSVRHLARMAKKTTHSRKSAKPVKAAAKRRTRTTGSVQRVVTPATTQVPARASAYAATSRIHELESLVDTISKSKKIWEQTFDVITDPVLIIDKDFTITRANIATAKAAGIDVRRIVGRKCYAAFAGLEEPCPKCPVQHTRATREPHRVELDAFPRLRQYAANAYTLDPSFSGRDETVLHYLDITDAKSLQKRFLQNEKMAAVGTLAGGIAHEINNPLGGILAFVQLAIRELAMEHPVQSDLKEIEEAALRCKTIVRNLLDFSRQGFDDGMGAVQLNEVALKAAALAKINARDHNVELATELDERLPLVRGNAAKLQQVLINLITNAVDAMRRTGGTLTISTGRSPDNRRVILRVRDTGTGIDRHHLDKIFDPYFTTKGQGEGTGLGLSISYGIIKEHKAKIDVDSKPGQGTVFTLQFNALAESSAQAAAL